MVSRVLWDFRVLRVTLDQLDLKVGKDFRVIKDFKVFKVGRDFKVFKEFKV
jgi:hypothetical protein